MYVQFTRSSLLKRRIKMYKNYYKWIFLTLFFSLYACTVFAQQTPQPAEETVSEMTDLKWQLQLMEESVERQQEQIKAIKERLDVVAAEPAPAEKIYNKEELA